MSRPFLMRGVGCSLAVAVCLSGLRGQPPQTGAAAPAQAASPAHHEASERVTAQVAGWLRQGDDAVTRGDLSAAEKAYQRAEREAENQCVTCFLRLAAAQRSAGHLGSAAQAAQAAVTAAAAQPGLLAEAHEAYGNILSAEAGYRQHDSSRLRQAQAEFEAALASEPSDPQVLRFKDGVILLRRGRNAEADRELTGVLQDARTPAPLAAEVHEVEAEPRLALAPIVPVFTLTTTAGETVSTATIVGKVMLFVFWNSYTRDSVRALPMLMALHKKFGSRADFRMVGVAIGNTPAEWRDFTTLHGLHWAQSVDMTGAVTRDFGIAALPTFIVVERNGAIATVARGLDERGDGTPSGQSQWLLDMTIRNALKAAPPAWVHR